MLIDSHCHLDYFDAPDAVVARARAAGVGGMLTIGTKIAAFPTVQAIAERHDGVWASVGIHPHEAANEAADEAALVAAAAHAKVVGIGETGLDYYYDKSPRPEQARNFRVHLAAARRTGLPAIVHTRDADADTAAMLEEEAGKGALRGVLHCFTSTAELATRALDLGFFVSFSGIVTFKNAEAVREVAKLVPLDRLLVETDAPYLAPVPVRGQRCEPAHVGHTAAFLAKLRGVPVAEFIALTGANFRRL
ncbi:MAG: TatD family deoxyribonuclease, partial [Alphaproteobacteria bacterium]|nr:TatD family deoxyribonuclease [Alphaproteobacteria bacterium]